MVGGNPRESTPLNSAQLSIGADHLYVLHAVVIFTFPNWHSRCPEAITTHIPVRRRCDGLFEATMFNVLRKPSNRFVLLQHFAALAIDIHEPAGVRPVYKLCATAVTVRVAVANILNAPNTAIVFKRLGDGLINIPDLLTFPRAASCSSRCRLGWIRSECRLAWP